MVMKTQSQNGVISLFTFYGRRLGICREKAAVRSRWPQIERLVTSLDVTAFYLCQSALILNFYLRVTTRLL